MKLLTTAAIAALMLAQANAAFAARAYIGTYTKDPAAARGLGNGEGIYMVDVDPATGAPSHLRLMAKDLSPSWITLSADHKFLYAVNEIATYGPNKSGSVTAYAVDTASGALKKLNVVDSGGSIPCFVSVHPSGKFLLVADYTGGAYEVIRLKPDGSL
ncbi:MAG TPA: beta-propeller fold lactonase family protein, partial [Rhizomicrobium sp.]